jgi:hypothetical protein
MKLPHHLLSLLVAKFGTFALFTLLDWHAALARHATPRPALTADLA